MEQQRLGQQRRQRLQPRLEQQWHLEPESPRRLFFNNVAGFINLSGGGMGMGMGGMGVNVGFNQSPGFQFNRWGSMCPGFQQMNGFTFVDYNSGWNASYHDNLLRSNIDFVFQQYDFNFSGQLTGNEFFYAYRDLCLRMGLAPPMSYQ